MEVLLEVDEEVVDTLIREPPRPTVLFGVLTPVERCRIPLDVHVCNSSSVFPVACPDSTLLSPTS